MKIFKPLPRSSYWAIAFISTLSACGCSHEKTVDTSSFFSDAEWQNSLGADVDVATLDVSGAGYIQTRMQFLTTQITKAMLTRNVWKKKVSDLPIAEQNAVRELATLEAKAVNPIDKPEAATDLEVTIEKRNDGFLNLILKSNEVPHTRNTSVTWLTAQKT